MNASLDAYYDYADNVDTEDGETLYNWYNAIALKDTGVADEIRDGVLEYISKYASNQDVNVSLNATVTMEPKMENLFDALVQIGENRKVAEGNA